MCNGKHTVNFKTNVQIKSIIGKDLINNDNVAILELVKNSFDAHAQNVEINFENIQTSELGESRLMIIDDGVGMSLEDIEQKWLNIAYSEKKVNHSANGRTMAGAKGVGRFSCDRLGEKLNLYTKCSGGDLLRLEINWSEFEVENEQALEIQHISLTCEEITDTDFESQFGQSLEHGTLIEIRKLRSKWTHFQPNKSNWSVEPLVKLRHYLEKIASPSSSFNEESFKLTLKAEEFSESDELLDSADRVNGPIKNKIFEKLPYTTTVIQTEINRENEIVTTLTDKNRKIVTIRERNTLVGLGGLKISIYYLNPYAKAYFTKQTGIRSVEYGSIFLFVNGFRVSGLGDHGDDWLGMENRKTQGYARFLGTREVVGRIEISDPQHKVKIVSSREGVVADELTKQIIDIETQRRKGFFYKTLRRLERYVVSGLDWDKTTESSDEIENEVLKTKGWEYTPDSESYKKSQSEKDRNLLKVIQPIVEQETRVDDLIDVEINVDILAEVREEADAGSREKFRKFIDKHNIDISKVDEIIQIKKKLSEAQERAKAAEETASEAEQRAIGAEQEAEQAKASLEQATGENLFLKSTRTKGSKEILALQHQIGHSSERISRSIGSVYELIEKGDFGKIKKSLKIIHLENQIISSVVNFVTQANFNLKTKYRTLDFVKFVTDYIEEVYVNYKHLIINNELVNPDVKDHGGVEFSMRFRPLEVIILIDNIFHNAHKANANNMTVEFEDVENYLLVKFSDDGNGLDSNIVDRVFDYGFTTTDGTGLGLYHAKEIAEKLNGLLEVSNTKSGAKFTLKIRR